jgi:hypothetical protein
MIFAGAILVAALAVPTAARAAPSAAPARPGATAAGQRLWVAGSPEQTFAEQVENTVNARPDQALAAATLADTLATRVRSGAPVTFPGVPESTGTRLAELAALSADMHQRARAEVATSASPGPAKRLLPEGPSSQVSPAPGAAGPADGGFWSNPPGFPVRGSTVSNGYAWKTQYLWNGGYFDSNGNYNLTDQESVQLTDNIGAVTTMFSFVARYFPSSGAFSDIHMQMFALCDGNTVCASENYPSDHSGNGTGTGQFYLSQPSMNGHQLAHAGILWVLDVNNPTRPGGGYEGDVARTSNATCALGPVNNVCQWQ